MTGRERQARLRERRRLRLQAPAMTTRAGDPTIPDEQLEPLEMAIRTFRLRVLDDLGGVAGLPLTRLLQVDSLATRWVIQGMLSSEVMDLGKSGRLVDRRAVRARGLMHDWLKATDGYERALRDVGLDPVNVTDPADTLEGIVAGIVAARPQAPVSPAEPADRPAPHPEAQERRPRQDGNDAPQERQAREPQGRTKPMTPEQGACLQAEPAVVTPRTLMPGGAVVVHEPDAADIMGDF